MKKQFTISIAVFLAVLSSTVYAESIILEDSVVKYDPFPAEAGDYFELFLLIQNKGVTEAKDVIIELKPSFPFSLDPDANPVRTLSTLAAGQETLVKFNVRVDENAIDGDNELDYTTSCSNCVKVNREIDISVNSDAARFEIGSIETEPARLKPGDDDAKIIIELQNIGGGDAILATASLSLPEGIVPSDSYSNQDSLGTVAGEDSENAEFFVDISESVQAGAKDAVLTIRYKNKGNSNNDFKVQEIPFSLIIKPVPIFEIESVEGSEIFAGSSNLVKITIKNIGTEQAESVVVTAMPKSEQPFTFSSKSSFIGTLDSQDTGEAVIEFSVDSDAVAKKEILDIRIRASGDADNGNNDVYVYNKKIELNVNPSSSSVPLIFVIIVILVILAFLWKTKRLPGMKKK